MSSLRDALVVLGGLALAVLLYACDSSPVRAPEVSPLATPAAVIEVSPLATPGQ